MGSGKISRRTFEALMRQRREQEQVWNTAVPKHTDQAAERAFRQMEAMVAAGVPIAAGATAAKAAGGSKAAGAVTAVKVLAVAAAGAAVIGMGTLAAVPAARQGLGQLLAPERAETAQTVSRLPGAYVIPSPGEDFTVTDQAQSDTLNARWFTSAHQQVLVQIARQLPEESSEGAAEAVTAGGLSGALYQSGSTQVLLLRDGDVLLRVQYFNGDRDTLLAYGQALAAANAQ